MKKSTLMKSAISLLLILMCLSIINGPKVFGLNPILFAVTAGILASVAVLIMHDLIPNGKPRPEDELKRGWCIMSSPLS